MDWIDEISKWAVGLGMLMMVLFPLALPILILTAVALLPLLVPLIAIALVGAVIGGPVLLVRRLLRGRGPRKRSGPHEGDRSVRVGTVNAGRAG